LIGVPSNWKSSRPLASGSLAMVSWYLIDRACFSLIYAGRFDGFHAVPASVSKTLKITLLVLLSQNNAGLLLEESGTYRDSHQHRRLRWVSGKLTIVNRV
jgi:hypothetical protein